MSHFDNKAVRSLARIGVRRCNATSHLISPSGFRACDWHAKGQEGFASTADCGPCDCPVDWQFAASMPERERRARPVFE